MGRITTPVVPARRPETRASALALALALALAAPAAHGQREPTREDELLSIPAQHPLSPADVARVTDWVRARAGVAPHWSTALPVSWPWSRQLYVNAWAHPGYAAVEIADEPNCRTARPCSFALFEARTNGHPLADAPFERITLPHRAPAHFVPMRCGANCALPRIEWIERGVLYSIDLLVDEAPDTHRGRLLAAARAALAASPPR